MRFRFFVEVIGKQPDCDGVFMVKFPQGEKFMVSAIDENQKKLLQEALDSGGSLRCSGVHLDPITGITTLLDLGK